MKKRIAVVTNCDYLWQKIRLTLNPSADCERAVAEALADFDLVLLDIRDRVNGPAAKNIITMGDGGDISLPFSFGELLFAVEHAEISARPALYLGERCAYLREKRIILTEVERTLLARLIEAGGEYVARDVLIESVWGGGVSGSVLNVYVHYLREKLEMGEKIILSSRKHGYGIDPKYLFTMPTKETQEKGVAEIC